MVSNINRSIALVHIPDVHKKIVMLDQTSIKTSMQILDAREIKSELDRIKGLSLSGFWPSFYFTTQIDCYIFGIKS